MTGERKTHDEHLDTIADDVMLDYLRRRGRLSGNTLLAKMWQAGLLMHSLTTEGCSLMMMDGTKVLLTTEENALFYLCTDHGGVLEVGDDRCQKHQSEALLAKAGIEL